MNISHLNSNCLHVKFFRHKKLKRTFVFPASKSDCRIDRNLNRLWQGKLRKVIHPQIYGYPKRKGIALAQLWIIRKKIEGHPLLRADISKGYHSVDMHRLMALCKRHGLLKGSHQNRLHYIFREKEVHLRGLAQGRSLSPILFALYMTPVMRRFSKNYDALLYADDLFVALRAGQTAEQALSDFNSCLSKNSYKDRKMELNINNEKEPELITRGQGLEFNGMKINPNGEFVPAADKSAAHFFRTVKHLRKILANRGDNDDVYRKTVNYLNKISPPTKYMEEDNVLSAQGLWYSNGFSLLDIITAFPTFHKRMEKLGAGHGELLGWQPVSSFTPLQQAERRKIWNKINKNPQRLNDLYKLQRDWKPKQNEASPFFQFMEELNAHFIAFLEFDTFTHEEDQLWLIKIQNGRLNDREVNYARLLFRNSLRIINDTEYFQKNMADFLIGLDFRLEKVQQFLRGWELKKIIELKCPNLIKFTPHMIKTIGTLAYPVWEFGQVEDILFYHQNGLLSSAQLSDAISGIALQMSEDDFIQSDVACAQTLGISPIEFRKILFQKGFISEAGYPYWRA